MAEFSVAIGQDETTVTCSTCGQTTTGSNTDLLIDYIRTDHTCPPISETIPSPDPETRIANPTDDDTQQDTGATAYPGTTITNRRPTPRTGRIPEWTDSRVTSAIIDAVAGGAYLTTAATAAGIHESTLFRWLAEAKADDAPEQLHEFYEAVTRARAMAEQTAVEFLWDVAKGGHLIRQSTRHDPAGEGYVVEESFTAPDAKPVMFLLERSFPQRWTRRSQLDVGLNPDGPAYGPTGQDDVERLNVLAQRAAAALATVRGEVVAEESA